MPFYVYILQLKDGRLYVGHSNNPPRRHSEHERGKGCRTTGIFGVNEIIHIEEYPDRPAAARREKLLPHLDVECFYPFERHHIRCRHRAAVDDGRWLMPGIGLPDAQGQGNPTVAALGACHVNEAA